MKEQFPKKYLKILVGRIPVIQSRKIPFIGMYKERLIKQKFSRTGYIARRNKLEL